jgi:hypothetical protein
LGKPGFTPVYFPVQAKFSAFLSCNNRRIVEELSGKAENGVKGRFWELQVTLRAENANPPCIQCITKSS